jgi:hypothetical protein
VTARVPAAVAAVLLAAGLTACSGKGGAQPVAAAPTACSSTATAVDLPSGFPAQFPLPPGTIVTSADDRGEAGIVVTGATPAAFKDVLAALQRELPARGFTPRDGETEPHDAESDWTSVDYDGRWAIRENPQCPGDVIVSVVARRK